MCALLLTYHGFGWLAWFLVLVITVKINTLKLVKKVE